MFTRPHYNDWIPLLSQQLRLRNVIKIIGENIHFHESKIERSSRIYYTLHHSLSSDVIYTSEEVTLHGNGTASWSEIDCELIKKTPCNSVCIKVWRKSTIAVGISTKNQNKETHKNVDEQIFVWGINFSGLILVSKYSNIKLKPNTLVFQIHGSYFTSPSRIIISLDKTEYINQNEEERIYNYCKLNSFKESKSQNVTSLKNAYKVKKDVAFSNESTFLNNSCDKVNKTYNLHGFESPNLSRSLDSKHTDNNIYSSQKNFSSASGNQTIEKQQKHFVESISFLNINEEQQSILNARYCAYNFRKKEIRPSYNLEKLLETQKQQRKTKLCSKDLKEISEHICLRSANCISLELLAKIKPGAIYHNYNKSKNSNTMGRTLNRLLFQEAEIKPEEVLKVQGFKKKIENVRFRLRMLKEEKKRLINSNNQLDKKLSELSDNNVEVGSWLMSRYRCLSKEKEILNKDKVDLIEKNDCLLKTQQKLQLVRSVFCRELKEIFQIEKRTSDKYTICKIYLPNTNELMDARHSQDSIFNVVPMSLNSALGYVAHVVKMCSVVFNIPLRNALKFDGSRTKIIDTPTEIPNITREFALYTRNYPPPKSVSYAIYLLNQNLCQLSFQINGIENFDPRATIENLLKLLLNDTSKLNKSPLQLVLPEDENKSIRSENPSLSSIDLHLDVKSTLGASKALDEVDYFVREPSVNIENDLRISRSVGSSSEDNFSLTYDKLFHSSEPNLKTNSISVHIESPTKSENF